jgi:hypothetical protein
MVAIIGITIGIFLFYFLASFNTLESKHRLVFTGFFLISTFILRILIGPELNKDYFGYYGLHDIKMPEDVMSFLFGEPYLKIVYVFFNLFTDDKTLIFLGIYWLNLLVANSFFVWILTRKDVQMWKKIVLFSFFYFLLAFVLIRNSPAYILFACYFYYSFRKIKFNAVLLTPFMHISSLAVLVTYFHKRKNYFLFFVALSIAVTLILLFILPNVSNSIAVKLSLSKIDAYAAEMEVVSVFHKIYFVFITCVVITTALIYKKEISHPLILTTILLYYISFILNPIAGFRFTPYLFFAILFYNYNGAYTKSLTRVLNIACFILLPYFIQTLIDTHYL